MPSFNIQMLKLSRNSDVCRETMSERQWTSSRYVPGCCIVFLLTLLLPAGLRHSPAIPFRARRRPYPCLVRSGPETVFNIPRIPSILPRDIRNLPAHLPPTFPPINHAAFTHRPSFRCFGTSLNTRSTRIRCKTDRRDMLPLSRAFIDGLHPGRRAAVQMLPAHPRRTEPRRSVGCSQGRDNRLYRVGPQSVHA